MQFVQVGRCLSPCSLVPAGTHEWETISFNEVPQHKSPLHCLKAVAGVFCVCWSVCWRKEHGVCLSSIALITPYWLALAGIWVVWLSLPRWLINSHPETLASCVCEVLNKYVIFVDRCFSDSSSFLLFFIENCILCSTVRSLSSDSTCVTIDRSNHYRLMFYLVCCDLLGSA